jgi:hypothetical protein
VPGPFDLLGQLALMFGAGAGLASGADLPVIADETAQRFDIFIIYGHLGIGAESALLFPREPLVVKLLSICHLVLLRVFLDSLMM